MTDQRANLTVLGCSPSWQNTGEACSSYLVEAAGTRLLIDCGNGAFAQLREHSDYATIDAIAITHTHGDHVLDLLPFAYALLYSPRALRGELNRPLLLLPPTAHERMRSIFALIDRAELLDDAYEVREYEPAEPIQVGSLVLEFAEVPHFVPVHAVSVRTSEGGRFVFGADHRPCDEIVDFARGADLLMLEATLMQPETGIRGHMTSEEAAEIAQSAGVTRLVLTHMSDELPREELLAQAKAVHANTVLAAAADEYRF
ncbi:MAG: MBL fold metallo-hydrolase [Solirubrobacteraceae bacterium]|nr:MBL fold metallo-hydrolase [Solirubrobacteraceae bacterium]